MFASGYDVTHFLSGLMLLVSFILLYQDRMFPILNVFAFQALVLALAVAWQAFIQDAPHLYITAGMALVMKAGVIPRALHRIVRKLGIHRDIETVVSVGMTLIAAVLLTLLAILIVVPLTGTQAAETREDLAFSLAIVLLGLLMMIMRRNAISQIVGFMSMENGLILAATAAKGMPLVVEISVAFSVLIAFFVFGVFVFRIRERFDTIDVNVLDKYRGERK